MNLFMLLQHCPGGLSCRVCEIGAKWSQSCSFVSASSRISSRQCAAFLCRSHLAFSQCVLLVYIWCIHPVVWIELQIGRNPVLFYRIDQISIWSTSLGVCWHHFQLRRCCCQGMWSNPLILGGCHLEWRWFLFKIYVLCFICIHIEANASHCFLLAIQKEFCFGFCICMKRTIVCVVCIYWVLSASCLFLNMKPFSFIWSNDVRTM